MLEEFKVQTGLKECYNCQNSAMSGLSASNLPVVYKCIRLSLIYPVIMELSYCSMQGGLNNKSETGNRIRELNDINSPKKAKDDRCGATEHQFN
jgi:hypothetical protein